MHGISQGVRVAEESRGLLHLAALNQGADIGGAHHAPVERHGLDHIAADAAPGAVIAQLLRRAFAAVAEAEIMADDDPGGLQLVDHRVGKVPPGHAHHMLVEVDEHHIVDAEAAADDLLAPDGAVDERHLFAEHQRVRVHVKGKHRGHGADLGCALLRFVQQRRVPDMYPVEKAERDGPFAVWHCFIPRKSF